MIAGTVSALGSAGDGIVLDGGKKTFVPFALECEVIEGGRLTHSSADRVEPACPHHGNLGVAGCGGCRMQHFDMAAYARWKSSLVADALKWARVEHPPLQPLQVSPMRSRRRAALTIERRDGRLRIGFNQRGTHNIVDLSVCLILKPELFALLAPMRQLPFLREGERADIVLTRLGNATDILIERRRDLDLVEREAVAAFAGEYDIARVSWRAGRRQEAEPVCHRAPFMAVFGDCPVGIPPGGFLQATDEGEAALVSVLQRAQRSGHRTIDLFAGSGTFTFPSTAYGAVHAVEASPDACRSITAASRDGITVERRNLFTDPVMDFTAYDLAIIDPPYAGAEAQASALAQSGPDTIVSISCNPLTFARDAAHLLHGGYRLEYVQPVDQFLWSADIEIAGILSRKNKP